MKKGFVYSLHVQGVWGRKRKVSFDSFAMGTDLELLTRTAIEMRALNMLAELKGKPGMRWSVHAYPCQHQDNGMNPLIQIMNNKVLIKGVVGGDTDWQVSA